MNDISDYMIRRCPLCGKPYLVWSTISGDQSVCADCRRAAFGSPYDYTRYSGTANDPRKFRPVSISREE